MNRRGFTLVELLTVMVVLGVLASIALPKYHLFTKRARAADVVAAMVAVRTAAYTYSESVGSWPASSALGQAPTGLEPYLPGGLDFEAADYSLAWTSMTVSLFGQPRSLKMVWMSTADPTICQATAGL